MRETIGVNYVILQWDWVQDHYRVFGRKKGLSAYRTFDVRNTDSMLSLLVEPDTLYEWAAVPVINDVAQPITEIREFRTLPLSEQICDDITAFEQTETEIIFTCTNNSEFIIHTFMVASAVVVNGVITPASGMDIVQIKREDLLNPGTSNPDYVNNPNGTYLNTTVLSEGVNESSHEVRFSRPLSGKIWVMIASTPGLSCDGVINQFLFDA